jgi:hypothetical protein
MNLKSDNKKQTVRIALAQFVEKEYKTDINKVTDRQRSLYLSEFYIKEIHNPKESEIDDDDILDGLIDGKNDLGVDFIHRDDGHVLLIQTKYFSLGTSINISEIIHFQETLQRLLDNNFPKNSKLADHLCDIDWENDTFHLKFICLGKIEGQAKTQSEKSINLPKDLERLKERVSFDFYDESMLNEEFRGALTLSEGLPGEHKIYSFGARSSRAPIIEVDCDGRKSVVMTVEANQLTSIYKAAKDKLFNLNIRNFIGSTKTNKEIISTAKEKPKQFFLFNNGVSCLANKLVISSDQTYVITEGLQIINGAQTIKSLVKAGMLDDKPMVLLRITEVPVTYGKHGAFASEITKYNNTQNVIKVSDFKSNDPIQRFLKNKFSEITRGGKRVEYINKRTDKKTPNTISVKMEDFCKIIYAFFENPTHFSGSSSFLFDESENGGYTKVFGSSDAMDSDEFKLKCSVWWMAVQFQDALKKYKEITTDKVALRALERKWLILFSARLILQRSFGVEDYKKKLISLYKTDWRIAENEVGIWFQDLFEIAVGNILYLYGEDAENQGASFVHGRWLKSPKTTEKIERFTMNASKTLQPLQ